MGRRKHTSMPYPPLQRAFDIAVRLHRGERFNVGRIADLYGLTVRQSYRIMREIECAFPVVSVDAGDNRQTTLRLMAAPRERRYTHDHHQPAQAAFAAENPSQEDGPAPVLLLASGAGH